MRDRIDRYSRRLEGLSIPELSRGAEKLVSVERRHTAALIAHLAEISRRKGHLELGYKSLFDYCVIRLRLGKGTVWNRTQVANVSRRFPQILEHLAEGKSSLSSLGVLAAHLSEENVEGLLEQAEGKTKEEVKEIVAALRPKPAAEPMIRRKPAARSLESRERPSEGAAEPAQLERPFSRGESESPKLVGNIEVASPGLYNFRFSSGKEFKGKFERLAEVLGIEGAVRRMPEILEKALDLALEKKDPKQKLQRREKREATRSKTPLDEAAGTPKCEGHDRSGYVPSSVRERRMEHAGYQCEYTGPDGVRCTARTRLEIDHPIPGKGRVERRGEPSGVLPWAQSSPCGAGVRGGVHEGEDRGAKEQAMRRRR